MSYMFVPNFEARDFGFRTQKLLRKFGVKSGLSQNTAQVRQKIFHMFVCLEIPFHPNQPTFGLDEIFFLSFCLFFPLFFFLIFVRSSPKPQNIKIYFLCKVVDLQTQFFLLKLFGATPPGTPKMGPQKINFLNGSS